MTNLSLEAFVSDLEPNEKQDRIGPTAGNKPITVWLPIDAKAAYDKLQESSGRKLSKKVREAVLALISLAEAKSAKN